MTAETDCGEKPLGGAGACRAETLLDKRRLRVLVIAAAVHPDKGSEPGLGWAWLTALAKHSEIWVIAGEREGNRSAIERELAAFPETWMSVRFHFLARTTSDSSSVAGMIKNYRLFRTWHLEASALATKLQTEVDFDVVHQLNMQGFREPGYGWALGKPFVWGPIGGVENLPLRFASVLGFRETLFHAMKIVVNELQLRFHPRVRLARRRAAVLISATTGTRRKLLRVWGRDSVVIPGPGLSLNPVEVGPRQLREGELRLAWSGLHVSRKALPLLLRALATVPRTCRWRLDILGDGPMRKQWQREAGALGIEDRCRWLGWLPRHAALATVAAADLFVFPTLHDAVPTVVIEALEAGVPVVGLSHCGLEDVVKDDCGVLIEPRGTKWVISELARVVERAAGDRDWLKGLGSNAAESVAEMAWTRRAAVVSDLYASAARSSTACKNSEAQ